MKRKYVPYVMIAPYFLIYFAFNLFPMLFSLGISFTDWDGIGKASFIGLENYVRVFSKDKFFYQSLWNTILLLLINTPIQIALGLTTAALIKDFLRKTRGAVQLVNFLPYITTPVAVGIIFQLMFAQKNGVVNGMLELLKISPVYWLGEAWATRLVVAFMQIWKGYGYMMIMFLSGLATIPDDLYEAASIDGAKWHQRFFKITVPMLKPIFVFVITTSVINGFKIFDEAQLLFNDSSQPLGGPGRSVLTVIMRFYEVSFKGSEFGYGSALAYCLFVIIALASLLVLKLINRKEES